MRSTETTMLIRVCAVALALCACGCKRPPPRRPATTQKAHAPSPAPATPPRSEPWTGVVEVTLPGDRPRAPARVTVHIPGGLDPRERFHVVAFFHGANECAATFVWNGLFDARHCGRRGTWVGYGGAGRHDLARTRSILIAPQLHSGRDGGLTAPGGLSRAPRAGAPDAPATFTVRVTTLAGWAGGPFHLTARRLTR